MSLKSRDARKALALAAVSAAALGAAAPSALAADTAAAKFKLSCEFPLVGASLIEADVTTTIPLTWPAGQKTPAFNITAKATTLEDADGTDASFQGLSLVKAKTLEGTGTANSSIAATGFALPDLGVGITIPNTTVPAAPPLVLTATGSTPPITFPKAGPGTIYIKSMDLVLKAFKSDGSAITGLAAAQTVPASDDDPTTFDAPCVPVDDSGAPITDGVKLADLNITGATPAPVTPAPVTPAPVTPAPETPAPVTPAPVTPAPVTPAPVTPAPVTPAPVTPKPVTPAPGTPKPGVKYGYNLAGSATLKTLTKGSLPLSGGVDATLQLSDGSFVGDLTLAPTKGNLVALGFLPVNAAVTIVPLTQVTGTLANNLTASVKVRIKIPSVTLFGLQLAGGAGCQAKNPSLINLKSPGEFSPLDGGVLTGTFGISDLVNCGFLTGIVSPLTAGNGNAIALNLTPKA